jgi:hypothetical protein
MTDNGDLVYDDGSETEIETDPDEPPRSGVFVDHDDLEPDDDELAEGERLGLEIDPDDDEDNGLPA